jgi:hypothetical protein
LVRSARTLYYREKRLAITYCQSAHEELYVVEYPTFINWLRFPRQVPLNQMKNH